MPVLASNVTEAVASPLFGMIGYASRSADRRGGLRPSRLSRAGVSSPTRLDQDVGGLNTRRRLPMEAEVDLPASGDIIGGEMLHARQPERCRVDDVVGAPIGDGMADRFVPPEPNMKVSSPTSDELSLPSLQLVGRVRHHRPCGWRQLRVRPDTSCQSASALERAINGSVAQTREWLCSPGIVHPLGHGSGPVCPSRQ